MRVDYGVGRSRGWRVDHDALCSLCVRSNFSSSLAPSLARLRARDRSPFSPLALSRPLCLPSSCPLLASIRPPPSTSDNYCRQSLSLPSIPRFFPMATSSLKAASSTSRSAGIQPSMRGRVVPSCRRHALAILLVQDVCVRCIYTFILDTCFSVVRRLLLMAEVTASYSLYARL